MPNLGTEGIIKAKIKGMIVFWYSWCLENAFCLFDRMHSVKVLKKPEPQSYSENTSGWLEVTIARKKYS